MTILQEPVTTGAETQFLLSDVSWECYQFLSERLAGSNIKMAYDRGSLHIMSPSRKHDKTGRILGLMVHILAEELNVTLDGGGSTRFTSADMERGVEPDECFYTLNEPRIRGKEEIDLSVDPPPDIAVEVEISRSLLDRKAIYAALGVPEIWCHDGLHVRILTLDANGNYQTSQTSRSFPSMPTSEIDRFVQMIWSMDQTAWARSFRRWVRDNLLK